MTEKFNKKSTLMNYLCYGTVRQNIRNLNLWSTVDSISLVHHTRLYLQANYRGWCGNPKPDDNERLARLVAARSRPVVVEGRYLVERSVDRRTIRIYVRLEINSLTWHFCNWRSGEADDLPWLSPVQSLFPLERWQIHRHWRGINTTPFDGMKKNRKKKNIHKHVV